MNAELQRKGRNKDTIINRAYIESANYRKKFDCISEDKRLNRLLYDLSKKMLNHVDAQIEALKEIQKKYDVMVKEVLL